MCDKFYIPPTEENNSRSKKIAISLGWSCVSASNSYHTGIRESKENGYNTCPFDLGITNFDGIVDCIEDDFKYFCDPNELCIIKINPECKYFNTHGDGDYIIYNKKYKFIFNHESPGHADLYLTEKWSGGITHFIDNDFEKFRIRYNNRIKNFINYLKDPNNIIIFCITYTDEIKNDYDRLRRVLNKNYPGLKYEVQLYKQSHPLEVNEMLCNYYDILKCVPRPLYRETIRTCGVNTTKNW